MLYWDIVKNCLISFHGFNEEEADCCIKRYFKRLKGDQKVIDFATHEEAFYLATRLAGKPHKEPTEQEETIYRRIQLTKETL